MRGTRENGFLYRGKEEGSHSNLVAERPRWDLGEDGNTEWDFFRKNALPFSQNCSRESRAVKCMVGWPMIWKPGK